jgi:predicted nuclease of restriction endonuclease-like (RecB) superfamily
VDERSFYEIEATSQNWTLRELHCQFQSGLYERLWVKRLEPIGLLLPA